MSREFVTIAGTVIAASLTVAMLFTAHSLIIWHFLGEPNYFIRNRDESDLWVYWVLQLLAGLVFGLFASVMVYATLQFTARTLCVRSFFSTAVLICVIIGFIHNLIEQTTKSYSPLSFGLYFLELSIAYVFATLLASASITETGRRSC